ncbi:MAG: sugar phosphate isomerase/epimerase [Acidobacteriota bacterium]
MDRSYGFIAGQESIEEHLDYAITHNFDHIEIDLRPGNSGLNGSGLEKISELKRIVSDRKVSFSFHLPGSINFAKSKFIFKRKFLNYLRSSIKLASELNATHITAHTGYFSRSVLWSDPREDFIQRAVDNILVISDICEEFNIKFALENLIPMPKHSAYHFIGDNIKDFQLIFSLAGSNNLGLCLDVGHSNLSEGALEYIKHFENRIVCVHYHDNMGKEDQHLEIGEGNIIWKNVIENLDRINFKGPYISECFRSEPHLTRKRLLDII